MASSPITLTSTVRKIEKNQKDTYLAYEVPVNPQSPEGMKVKINIRHYAHGNVEQWAAWKKDFEYLKQSAGWAAGPVLFRNARMILTDSAKDLLEDCRTQIGGNETVDTFNQTIELMTQLYCPDRAALAVKKYLQETPKPFGMSIDEYYARIREINTFIPHLPRPGNVALTQEEIRYAIIANVPRAWRAHYDFSGQDFQNLNALITYFRRCENHEKGPKRSAEDPSKKGNDRDGRNNNKKPPPPKEHGKGKNTEQKNKKYCKFHKTNTHDTSECRAKKKQEEANVMESSDEECNAMRAMQRHRHGEFKEEPGAPATTEVALAVEHSKGHYEVLHALMDCGASRSIIKKDLVPRKRQIAKQGMTWRTKAGKFRTVGQTTLGFKLPGFTTHRKLEFTFHVQEENAHDQYDVILGRDFLRHAGIGLDFKREMLCWDELEIPMNKRSTTAELMEAIATPKVVQDAEERVARILDARYEKQDLDAVPLEHLDNNGEKAMRKLLQEFSGLFEGRLGQMPGEPYEVTLKPHVKPYHARAFGIPQIHVATLKKELERLSDLGVIKKDSSSPWAAPAFIIPKKNGTVRFLTDFRKLNECIVRHPFPMPKISELLQSIPCFFCVTSVDFNMGYYAMELSEATSKLCSFVVPWGKYRYLRLPMGICTAPDEFQRRMQQLLGDLDYVRVYLDDVLIIGTTNLEDHLRQLRTVFTRFQEHHMQINALKSRFAVPETEYLGFRLSQHGVSPLPDKIRAVQRLRPPTTKRDLRRFIGMVNYYRDMWPLRAHTLAPLTDLTRKSTKFEWREKHQQAFDRVKQRLSQAATLHYPDFTCPFEIYTDASTFQLGGVIMQKGKPLAFYSRKLNAAQCKYTVMEQELLSIVEILREFRNILLGHEIVVYTDHKNLSFTNLNSARVHRWRLLVEEFGPQIRYVKGVNNVVADTLSRHPMSGQEKEIEEEAYMVDLKDPDLFPMSYEVLAEVQKTDPTMDEAMKQHGLEEREKQGYKIMYHNEQIFIPPSLRQQVMEFYHEMLRHPGVTRMLGSISPHLTWPKMKQDIMQHVLQCKMCQTWKRSNKKYGKIPVKDPITQPWQVVCVDQIGPYTQSNHEAAPKLWAQTMIDPATSWFEVKAIASKTAKTAAQVFDEEWLCRYPRPQEVIFDQGSEFKAEFLETLKVYGIKPKPTTVKNPQANAILERIHQVIGNMVRTNIALTAERWSEILPAVAFAIRATYHTTLQASPAQLVFGRDMMLDTAFTANWQIIRERKLAQVQTDNARENESRIAHEYKKGDLVLIKKDTKKLAKLEKPTLGPYKILQVKTNGTVIIQREGYCERINIRRLVPFRSIGEANAIY